MRDLADLSKFVSNLRVPRPPKRKKEKPIQKFAKRKPRTVRKYSQDFRQVVVNLYFRHLQMNAPEGEKPMSLSQVSKILDLPKSTVNKFITTWKTKGDLQDRRKGKFKMIPPEVQAKLISEEVLQKWCRHSLAERPSQIQKEYGIDVSVQTLHRFYIENGIKYKRNKAILRQTYNRQEMIDMQRAQFAIKLATAIRSGKKIGYMDESRIDNWSTKSMSWSGKYTNNYVVKNTKLISITLYGTIGLEEPCIGYFKGCNSENMLEYLQDLKRVASLTRGSNKRKPVLVVDQHGSHLKLKAELEKTFEVLVLPPQSCEFNSVESLWARIKLVFRKRLCQQPELNWTEEDFRQTVKEISESVAKQYHRQLCRSNVRYMERYINKARLLGMNAN